MKRFAMFTALVAHVAIAQAAPETFVIDASQTASEFSYRYLGISNQTHRFDRISARSCSTWPPKPARPTW